jgi:hypothetical protein
MKNVSGDLLSTSSLLLAIIGHLYSVWYAETTRPERSTGANLGVTRRRIEKIGTIFRSRAPPHFPATLLVAAILVVPSYQMVRG